MADEIFNTSVFNATTLEKSPDKHLYWLDWFRFLAAFEVVATHAGGLNWVTYDQLDSGSRAIVSRLFFFFINMGTQAVVLFFVLSGFLVGGKVLERVMNGSFDLKAYILDRITRIYIPLVPALLFTWISNCLICGREFSGLNLIGNMLGLQGVLSFVPAFAGNDPLWTLAYEYWFYFLAGFVAIICTGGGRAKIIALWGAFLVFVVFTRLEAALLFCWCLGAFGYQLAGNKPSNTLASAGGVIAAIVGACFSVYIAEHKASFGSFLSSGQVALLLYSAGLAVVLACVAKRKPQSGWVARFERKGSRLAAFSYTLYLTHHPMLTLWEKYRPGKYTTLEAHTFLWFFAECTSCLLVAWLIYLPFEAQTQRVREWMKRYISFPNFRG